MDYSITGNYCKLDIQKLLGFCLLFSIFNFTPTTRQKERVISKYHGRKNIWTTVSGATIVS
jgi:hypothetical protein